MRIIPLPYLFIEKLLLIPFPKTWIRNFLIEDFNTTAYSQEKEFFFPFKIYSNIPIFKMV